MLDVDFTGVMLLSSIVVALGSSSSCFPNEFGLIVHSFWLPALANDLIDGLKKNVQFQPFFNPINLDFIRLAKLRTSNPLIASWILV